MASTNKTTHYELSQYVSSDKPTYLIDYNGDMAKIDTAINTAKTTADTASTAATNAQTAAEGAQSTANTAVTNAATADTKATNADNKIGDLANLETTAKTNVVSAINEVKGNIIDSMAGSETTKAPSVSSVKSYIAPITSTDANGWLVKDYKDRTEYYKKYKWNRGTVTFPTWGRIEINDTPVNLNLDNCYITSSCMADDGVFATSIGYDSDLKRLDYQWCQYGTSGSATLIIYAQIRIVKFK